MTPFPTTPPTGGGNPALDALGERLETAAGTAIASGGMPSAGRNWGRVAFVPVLAAFVLAGAAIAVLVPGGGGTSAEAAVLAAAQETSDRATGRFEVTVDASVGGVAQPLSMRMEGAYDLDAERFRAAIDVGSMVPGGGAVPGLDGAIEMVVAGDQAYLRVGMLGGVFGGAEWIGIPLPDVPGDAGLAMPVMEPRAFLDALEGIGAEVTEVGREEVRGVPTTHYRGMISLARAYEELPVEDREALERTFADLFDALELPDLPVDVWIDDEGLIRRMQLSVDGSAFGPVGMGAGSVTVTVELFDIGEPVDIPIPSPDEIMDLGSLLPESFLDLFDGMGDWELPGDPFEDLTDDLDFGALMDELEGLMEGMDLDGMLEGFEDLFEEFQLPGSPGPRQEDRNEPEETSPVTT